MSNSWGIPEGQSTDAWGAPIGQVWNSNSLLAIQEEEKNKQKQEKKQDKEQEYNRDKSRGESKEGLNRNYNKKLTDEEYRAIKEERNRRLEREALEHKARLAELDSKLPKSFEDFLKNETLLRGIYSYGFEVPSRIQALSIPIIMTGKDVIAQSQSGTGKTGAFTISALNHVDVTKEYPQVIIISNTRELSEQIYGVITELSRYMNIKICLCVGGIDKRENLNALKTSHVIVGTPGRIHDLIASRGFDPKLVTLLIMDEADELLIQGKEKGFFNQVMDIVEILPKKAQICIFSATLPPDVVDVANRFMNEPENLLIQKENLTLDLINQYYIETTSNSRDMTANESKLSVIIDLYAQLSINQCIIYANSINTLEWLNDKLAEQNYIVGMIHSKLDNKTRSDIMRKFRTCEYRILLATDLMCRGIDIQQVSYVINFDLPRNPEPYLHRIGRSGRYGKKGVAINLVDRRDRQTLNAIQRHYRTKIEEMPSPEDLSDYLTS